MVQVWSGTEEAAWTKNSRGVKGCQTGDSRSRIESLKQSSRVLCAFVWYTVRMEIRSILLPTDFSECGNYALSYAASLARRFGASIICINVIEPIVPTVGYSGMTEPLPIADITEQLEDSAERELPKLAECDECSGLDVEEVVVHGEAASEIVRVAKERDVDLIVISSHGRTGLGRILFGSTAESVVRHASCPVLVVKPPQDREPEQ
jgi:nucleotide-binding universal stress UspA family protein